MSVVAWHCRCPTTAGRGRNTAVVLVDHGSVIVDQIHFAVDRPMPMGSRSEITLRPSRAAIAGARPRAPRRCHEPRRHAARSVQTNFRRRPSSTAGLHSRQSLVAADDDAIDLEQAFWHEVRSAVDAVQEQRRNQDVANQRFDDSAPGAVPARRLGVPGSADRRARQPRSRRSPQPFQRGVSPAAIERLDEARAMPIDPAPSVITTSPGRATRNKAGTTSSSRATTSTVALTL